MTTTPMDIQDAARAVDMHEPDYQNAEVVNERVPGVINKEGDTQGVQETGRRMTVWRTDTGEQLTILSAFYDETMRHLHPRTGLPLYSRYPVQIPAEAQGQIVCALHMRAPDRVILDAMGLPYCEKEGFHNHFQMLRHLERRHADSHAVIEANKKELERQEQLASNNMVRDALNSFAQTFAQQSKAQAQLVVEQHQHKYDADGNCIAYEGCPWKRPEKAA